MPPVLFLLFLFMFLFFSFPSVTRRPCRHHLGASCLGLFIKLGGPLNALTSAKFSIGFTLSRTYAHILVSDAHSAYLFPPFFLFYYFCLFSSYVCVFGVKRERRKKGCCGAVVRLLSASPQRSAPCPCIGSGRHFALVRLRCRRRLFSSSCLFF